MLMFHLGAPALGAGAENPGADLPPATPPPSGSPAATPDGLAPKFVKSTMTYQDPGIVAPGPPILAQDPTKIVFPPTPPGPALPGVEPFLRTPPKWVWAAVGVVVAGAVTGVLLSQ